MLLILNLILLFVIQCCVSRTSSIIKFKISETACLNFEGELGYCVEHRRCCNDFGHWNYNGNCTKYEYCCVNVNKKLCSVCQTGYQENDKGDCVDKNECETSDGLCSGHNCVNTVGSYECDCFDSFETIGKTCRHMNLSETNELLFSTSFTISLLQLNINEFMLQLSNYTLLYTETVSPKSIDYSFGGNYMAWTDTTHNQLNVGPINHKNPGLIEERISVKNMQKPNTLSIDWIHNLIYFTDLETNTINVLSIERPENYSPLIQLQRKPNDLIVNVMDSCLIWSFGVGFRPQIMRSLQDGSQETVLYSSHKQPVHITIDIFLKRYFFIDVQDYSLNSIDFTGNNDRRHFKLTFSGNINSALIYFDKLLLLTNNSIYSMNKFSDSLGARIYSERQYPKYLTNNNINQLFDFKIIDPLLQPELKNKCLFANCSHICLPSNDRQVFRCVCPLNYTLIYNSICLEDKNSNVSEIRVKTPQKDLLIKEVISFENKTKITEKPIPFVIQNEKRTTENVLLILILITILIISIFFGYKMKFIRIRMISRYGSQTRALYKRSDDIISVE